MAVLFEQLFFNLGSGNAQIASYLGEDSCKGSDAKRTTSRYCDAVLSSQIGMQPQMAIRLTDDPITVLAAQ